MKKKYLSLAIGSAIALQMASGAAAQQAEIEQITVVGSRISRPEFPAGSQIIQIDRENIDATGDLIISDVLRTNPLNIGGSFSERSGSSAQSNATVSLRGLGDNRTLVTLNGRRMVGSPNLGQATVNLNMLPMAAIQNIEILADGASSVYGSDAVAGVVDIRLRENFEGLEVYARSGRRDNDTGQENSVSVIGGLNHDRGNITFAVERDRRDPIFDRDRAYTAPWVRDSEGDGVDAYVDTDGYSYYGKSIWLYDPTTGYDQILAATSCSAGNGFLGEVDAVKDWAPTVEPSTYCMYGYGDVSANKAELDRINSYVSATYEINDNLEFYAQILNSKVKSFGRFAPPAALWEDMPADYPDVPFDIDALLASGAITENYSLTGLYRWTNIGPRDNYVTDTLGDYTFGLRGDFGASTYDVYVQESTYESQEFGYYYLSYTGLDYVMAQGIDPFSEAGAAAMSATTTQDNKSDMSKVYAQIQFPVTESTTALVGAESMRFDYKNVYDRASSGGFVGGSAGNSSYGTRDVFALFGEVLWDLGDLGVNVQARYDDYDDFGTAVSPSLAATYQLTNNVSIRGRYGEAFLAPALSALYGPDSFSAESGRDYARCENAGIALTSCSSSQYNTYYSSNPNLEAEESQSYSFGINVGLPANFNVDLGYYNINIDNLAFTPSVQSLFNAQLAGTVLTEASGIYIDRPTEFGRPSAIYSTGTNEGSYTTDGIDINISTGYETRFGLFTANLFWTEMLSSEGQSFYKGPVQDTAGFYLSPESRAQFVVGWRKGNNNVDWVVDYIGTSGLNDTVDFSTGLPLLKTSGDLGDWTTHSLSYTYNSPWGAFGVGANNLLNEDPILDSLGKYEVGHPDLYDNTGRVVYFDWKYSF